MSNVRYSTGFSGSAGSAVLTENGSFFLTDFRYAEQIKSEVTEYDHIIRQNMLECLNEVSLMQAGMKVGFEADYMSISELNLLKENFPNVEWVETNLIVERVAAVKDENEIECFRAACKIIDAVFEEILDIIKEGVTENELAAEVSYRTKMMGSEVDPFEPIIASGWRSALPHGISSTKKIKKGEMLVIDFGATVGGYAGDMTRTVAVGDPDEKMVQIYEVVLGAQKAAVDSAKEGISGAELDAVARGYISERHYGEQFGHSLGHGLGLDVHSWPRVSEVNKEPLLTNMVVTIEPGVYLPGLGGVRIEDDIVIKKDGCENLTGSPKEFISVG